MQFVDCQNRFWISASLSARLKTRGSSIMPLNRLPPVESAPIRRVLALVGIGCPTVSVMVPAGAPLT